jgi:predicted esterase
MRSETKETHRIQVPCFAVCDFTLRKVERPKQLVLLLHGYAESGRKIFKLLEPQIGSDAVVLAPNGPFPMPRRIPNGYAVGFSWYFYDDSRDEYFIDMELGLTYLRGVVTGLGLDHLPLTVIGFSQGGYLAPFLGQSLTQTRHVIGIGCEFLAEELKAGIPFRIDAMHGGKDDVVSASRAQSSHTKLLGRVAAQVSIKGEFRLFPETGHEISQEIQASVKSLTSIPM